MQSPRRYRSPAREAASNKTRERVVAAAVRLLRSADGAQRCTLESVAKGAGVTRLTVYNLFGARSALFEAVFDERARRGGLHRIAEAMILDDPRASIAALVAIFNEFWASDRATLGNLYALGSSDAEFAAVLLARNERRRQAFTVLAKRLAAAGQIEPQAIDDLADVLFALTAYAFFEDLTSRGRAPLAALEIVRAAADDAIARAALPGRGAD